MQSSMENLTSLLISRRNGSDRHGHHPLEGNSAWDYPILYPLSINRLALDMKALDENNQVASLSIDRQYSYETDGLIWKLGMVWDLLPIRLGMTVTTPKIKLRGKGSALFEQYLMGIDTTCDGSKDDFYLIDIQDNLKSNFHSLWAIGLGVGIHFKREIIHLSTEWYRKVPRYTPIQTAPFKGQSTGEEMHFRLVDELDPVFNYGIGI
jgi:hypothetical protein